jgi:general secretion pathway protein J
VNDVPRTATKGFTLVELLVAVAVFGILSAMAYRALTVVLESRGRIERENRKWREVALLLLRMEQDIASVAPRPVRGAGNLFSPAFVGQVNARPAEAAVMLTRTALADSPGGVEPPRRVGYRLRDGVVELLTWGELDQAPRSEPRISVALRGVQALDLRYVDQRGEWHANWPPVTDPAAETRIPAGVEASITLASGERVVRLFPTAARLPE